MSFLKGWMIGQAITGGMSPAGGSVDNRNYAGEEMLLDQFIEARDRAVELAGQVAELTDQVENWRIYASRLRANLDARKASESTLLEDLKRENINHPLATREGFEAMFQEMLCNQFALPDEPFNARINQEMADSVEFGRRAVDAGPEWPLIREQIILDAAAEKKRKITEAIDEEARRIAGGEAYFISMMPLKILQLSVEERARQAKKLNEEFSLGFLSELPEWVALEKSRIQAVAELQTKGERDAQDAAEHKQQKAADAASEEARHLAKEARSIRLAEGEDPFLALMPAEIAQLPTEERARKAKKLKEDFSFGFVSVLPEWLKHEEARSLAAMVEARK